MSRFFKLLILLIIIVFVLFIIAWGFLPSYLSRELSEKTKVDVKIESLQFSPHTIKLDHISIGSPPHAKFEKSMRLKKALFDAAIWNYFKRKIHIEEINLHDMELYIELNGPKGTNGNWNYILNNLSSSSQKKDAKGSSVLIDRLILTDIRIKLYDHKKGQVQELKPIDRIELKNISSEEGIPSAQIMNIILRETIRNVFSIQGIEGFIQDVIPSDKKGFFNFFKG